MFILKTVPKVIHYNQYQKTILNLAIATLPDAGILFDLSPSKYQKKKCIFDKFNDQTAIKAIILYATTPYVYREQGPLTFFFIFLSRTIVLQTLAHATDDIVTIITFCWVPK